uniref:GPN-loop GTPase 3 n=1 Tax=Aureoumbra lagunensis TaxID=44058 RepID=A0A7S3K4J7_9STRA
MICIGNLDPAIDYIPYEADIDIRELITIDDAMTELNFGPNGGLVYCMEYLDSHMVWLEEKLNEFGPDDTILFDCPGQLELYTHVPVMPRLCNALQRWGHHLCCVYLMDATALADSNKFISGSLAGLAAMLQLPAPRLTVLSKSDLVSQESLEAFLDMGSSSVFLERHDHLEIVRLGINDSQRKRGRRNNTRTKAPFSSGGGKSKAFTRLQYAISNVVDDHAMLSFIPFSIHDEESAGDLLAHIDHLTQYYEYAEVRIPEDENFPSGEDNFDYGLNEDLDPRSLTEASQALFGPGFIQ